MIHDNIKLKLIIFLLILETRIKDYDAATIKTTGITATGYQLP